MNLLTADYWASRNPEVDVPVWERPPLTVCDESGHTGQGREPSGPVDLYTWPSRRIRLIAEGDRVTRVIIANGNRLQPHNRHLFEPHTAWQRSPNQEKQLKSTLPVYMPRPHDPDRAIWRGLESLLPAATAPQSSEPAKYLAPGVLGWLGQLCMNLALPPDFQATIRAVGMIYGRNESVIADIVHDSIDLAAVLARQDATDLVETAKSCVRAADRAANAVGNLAADLVTATGGSGKGRHSRVREQLFADLDEEFRQWLRRLRSDSDPVDAEIAWHHIVRRAADAAATELLRSIPPAAWKGREVQKKPFTAAHADIKFRKDLANALPHAFATTPA